MYITDALVAFDHEVYTKITTRYCEHGFTSHVITHFVGNITARQSLVQIVLGREILKNLLKEDAVAAV